MSAQKSYWWEDDPEERFWMEAIAHPEFDTRLIAAYNRGKDGGNMPFHTTVGMVREGDVVLHWMTGSHHAVQTFVGYSTVNGFSFPTEADRNEAAGPRPGRAALLRDLTEFPVSIAPAVPYERRDEVVDLTASLADSVRARQRDWSQELHLPFWALPPSGAPWSCVHCGRRRRLSNRTAPASLASTGPGLLDVSVTIRAEHGDGFDDSVAHAVSENARTLGADDSHFEQG